MDIPIHANVTCSDGLVGKSTHIIMDLVKEEVSHFVVKTDQHSQEFVVPIEKMKDSDRTVIFLDCRKEDVYQFPPFKETHFIGIFLPPIFSYLLPFGFQFPFFSAQFSFL